jgi:energy-coupling factor transporter ATP-binding protein EcfA2
VLRLHGVSYRHAGANRDSLHGVDLELVAGTVTGLTGPAEAGKSTLCLVAGGLAPRVLGGRLVGHVTLDGRDVTGWPMHRLAEQVVTGLQDPAGQLSLIADSVFAEVAFGPANLGLERAEVMARVASALARVGIEELADRHPERLSVGQQQLVVLAGLLAMEPRVLILDEPLAHLDAAASRLVLDAIGAIGASGSAVLVAEQRTDALASVCDSLAVIAHGNVVARGAAREVLREPAVAALGVEELADERLARLLREAGLDPADLDPARLDPARGEAP